MTLQTAELADIRRAEQAMHAYATGDQSGFDAVIAEAEKSGRWPELVAAFCFAWNRLCGFSTNADARAALASEVDKLVLLELEERNDL